MKYLKLTLVCATAVLLWTALAIVLAFYGWWMNPVAEPGNADDFHAWAVTQVESNNRGTAALVLLENGEVTSQHFAGPVEVDQNTLFPTASFSKWITALAVMSLVEEGKLDLDAPVSQYLTRWQLPDSAFDNDQVTVRRLLSHTAGLTDELGFGDYQADETVPTLEESLETPRASRGAGAVITVGREPGNEFLYSGGGYLILELVIEEVSGDSFADYVRRSVLESAAMSRSTHEYPRDLENASPSYNLDGSKAPMYRYASAAATGFASTASDLSRLARAILLNDRILLSAETIEAMRQPHAFIMGSGIWGLGTILYVETPSGDFVFGHDGGNEPAINATVRINPDTSDGIIVLVSGHPSLASNIASEWVLWQTGYPDFLSTGRILESALIPVFVGSLAIMLVIVFGWRRRQPSTASSTERT